MNRRPSVQFDLTLFLRLTLQVTLRLETQQQSQHQAEESSPLPIGLQFWSWLAFGCHPPAPSAEGERNKRRKLGLLGLSEGSADEPSLELYDGEDCDLANVSHTHEYSNQVGDTEDYQPEGGGNSGFHSLLLPPLSAVVLMLGKLLVLAACREGSVMDPRR